MYSHFGQSFDKISYGSRSTRKIVRLFNCFVNRLDKNSELEEKHYPSGNVIGMYLSLPLPAPKKNPARCTTGEMVRGKRTKQKRK
jgi:hypothetical protein